MLPKYVYVVSISKVIVYDMCLWHCGTTRVNMSIGHLMTVHNCISKEVDYLTMSSESVLFQS